MVITCITCPYSYLPHGADMHLLFIQLAVPCWWHASPVHTASCPMLVTCISCPKSYLPHVCDMHFLSMQLAVPYWWHNLLSIQLAIPCWWHTFPVHNASCFLFIFSDIHPIKKPYRLLSPKDGYLIGCLQVQGIPWSHVDKINPKEEL